MTINTFLDFLRKTKTISDKRKRDDGIIKFFFVIVRLFTQG